MNAKIKISFIFFVLLLTFLYTFRSVAVSIENSQKPILLTHVYHHTNGDAHYLHYVELGTLIFYFSQPVTPTIFDEQLLSNGWREQLFFFPSIICPNQEVLTMIDRANNKKDSHYKIFIEPVMERKNQCKGLRCVLQYNPKKVAFSYDHFTSIKGSPGGIIRFLNREVTEKMNKKTAKHSMTVLALDTQKPCIVIDPGHGGKDTGAIGLYQAQEKTICFLVSNKVVHDLRASGYQALLTRTTDCDLFFDERSEYANNINADLFVSIHANSATNAKANGIETFYGKIPGITPFFSTFHASEKKFFDECTMHREQESQHLAQSIQQSLCTISYEGTVHPYNRGVKSAASQILLGTHMPAVLVEIGFITHEKEAIYLQNNNNQEKIARAITQGILDHLHKKQLL